MGYSRATSTTRRRPPKRGAAAGSTPANTVRQDADGMLYFVDHSKNIIRRFGENVAAAEVEAVLQESAPWVKQVAVVAYHGRGARGRGARLCRAARRHQHRCRLRPRSARLGSRASRLLPRRRAGCCSSTRCRPRERRRSRSTRFSARARIAPSAQASTICAVSQEASLNCSLVLFVGCRNRAKQRPGRHPNGRPVGCSLAESAAEGSSSGAQWPGPALGGKLMLTSVVAGIRNVRQYPELQGALFLVTGILSDSGFDIARGFAKAGSGWCCRCRRRAALTPRARSTALPGSRQYRERDPRQRARARHRRCRRPLRPGCCPGLRRTRRGDQRRRPEVGAPAAGRDHRGDRGGDFRQLLQQAYLHLAHRRQSDEPDLDRRADPQRRAGAPRAQSDAGRVQRLPAPGARRDDPRRGWHLGLERHSRRRRRPACLRRPGWMMLAARPSMVWLVRPTSRPSRCTWPRSAAGRCRATCSTPRRSPGRNC